MQYLAVGIVGMAGALARYDISIVFATGFGFPFATLIANLCNYFLLEIIKRLRNHNKIV
ncbi:hypothetical protein [Virgibacillus ihumii]|uniref:hypothetical protein n=1 Tax=Virgibacillus ihumii TaxID=2686091 RepID=UPI00157E0D95|nr:hypothetical protein [Virgibacillus ihumii]